MHGSHCEGPASHAPLWQDCHQFRGGDLDTSRLQELWYRKELSFQVPAFLIHRLLIPHPSVLTQPQSRGKESETMCSPFPTNTAPTLPGPEQVPGLLHCRHIAHLTAISQASLSCDFTASPAQGSSTIILTTKLLVFPWRR